MWVRIKIQDENKHNGHDNVQETTKIKFPLKLIDYIKMYKTTVKCHYSDLKQTENSFIKNMLKWKFVEINIECRKMHCHKQTAYFNAK